MKYMSGIRIFLFVVFAIFAQTGNTAASAMDDAKDIIDRNSGQSNRELAEKIYTDLNRKYSGRNWFVTVYDPVRGAEPHWIGVCGGDYTFRYHGYNLLVASSSSGTSALNRNWAYGKLSNAPLYKRGFWVNQVEIFAREIFYRMSPDEVGEQCDDWYAFGLVHHSANFYAKADWSRKVTYTKLGEQRRGGHRHGYTFFLFK